MGNYQYTIQGIEPQKVYEDAEKIMTAMRENDHFSQVISDMHNNAPYSYVKINRDRAYDLNVSAEALEYAFDYAYAGGKISLINATTDQYDVIIETLPKDYAYPDDLTKLYISASSKTPIHTHDPSKDKKKAYPTQIPLSEIVTIEEGIGPLSVAHLNTQPSATISFDLAPNIPLGSAVDELNAIASDALSPGTLAHVQGSADVFKKSFESLASLFLVTFFLIYVILGVLYENFIHPLTVMSAIPPAGLGAVLTLMAFGEPLSLYAFVGIIMLLGIVLKNGIMMVDFANEGISQGKPVHEAIYEACKARFRPILMTTFAAMMGAVPIALGIGGLTAESRRPLGLVIVGGLIISQILTLFFTPIIFVYLEKMREWVKSRSVAEPKAPES